jgi:hypothetical protein
MMQFCLSIKIQGLISIQQDHTDSLILVAGTILFFVFKKAFGVPFWERLLILLTGFFRD